MKNVPSHNDVHDEHAVHDKTVELDLFFEQLANQPKDASPELAATIVRSIKHLKASETESAHSINWLEWFELRPWRTGFAMVVPFFICFGLGFGMGFSQETDVSVSIDSLIFAEALENLSPDVSWIGGEHES